MRARYVPAAVGGAGWRRPPPPAREPPPAETDDAYERRLKLTDVIGFVALNGYAREANTCAGLCRETWRCIPAGLSASDADRVRRDHPLWQAIIDLPHGGKRRTRLRSAVHRGDLARVRELCDWRAGVDARCASGWTALHWACCFGQKDIARELISHGADVNSTIHDSRSTPLILACFHGQLSTARLLLAAGADKRRVNKFGRTAHFLSRADIVALLDASP